MSITNKYQNSGSELGINLNKGYFYDITPHVKNLSNMNLLYSTSLYDDKLSVDVNPNTKEIYHINDTTIPQSMMNNFLGKDGFDNNGLFYRYHFKTPGKHLFQNIMPCGWTFETVLNFNNVPTGPFSVFYYLGVGFEKELVNGELIDTSRNYPMDYLHNNIAFGFDENKSIVIRSARYTEECYGCESQDEVYSTNACDEDSSVPVTVGSLVTGSTLFEHSFNKGVCADDNSNFVVTVKFERDASIINNMCTSLGTKFIESESERMGTLKVYVNGLLYGVLHNFEDIVTRKASLPVHEFVQGWGFSDNFFISEDYNMFGHFDGLQPRGRFHGTPLSLEEIRHNYEMLKECYDITDCFELGCGPSFPERVINECPTTTPTTTSAPTTTTTTSSNGGGGEPTTTTTTTLEPVTQYLSVDLSESNKFKLSLWQDEAHTVPASAVCDYVVSGTAYGDLGTVFNGTETIVHGDHIHQFNLASVLLENEIVIDFSVDGFDTSACEQEVTIVYTPVTTTTTTVEQLSSGNCVSYTATNNGQSDENIIYYDCDNFYYNVTLPSGSISEFCASQISQYGENITLISNGNCAESTTTTTTIV